MGRLPSTQLRHQETPIPVTRDRGSLGQAMNGQVLHQAGHQGYLSQCKNQGRRRMEDNLHHKIRHIRILGHALWANQCTRGIAKMDQQELAVIYRQMLHCISGRCPQIFGQPGTTPKGRGGYHPCHTKARDETPAIEMRVSPTRNRISRIHHQQRRSQSRPYQNRSHRGLETTHQ